MKPFRRLLLGLVGLAAAATQMGGCPTAGFPLEYIEGGTGDRATIGAVASVTVLSPVSDLAITGGTPVQVNWQAIATTRFAAIDLIFDLDQSPDNDNEIIGLSNLTVDENSALLDTTELDAGVYFIGVVLREVGQIVAFGYAPGRLILNQRPRLFFDSPRDNYRFDRTIRLNPTFDVSWTVSDPDSTIGVQVFLDPDNSPNGNEVLLRESNLQTGDSFSFDLPTADFEPGTYRILALVSDGVDVFPFYAPASIQLRSRLAGYIDLRDMHLPQNDIRGAVFEGFNPRDNAGSFVDSTRDVDNDGFADFIILAQFGKPAYQFGSERTGVGEAYLIYGRPDRFTGNVNLNSTGTLFRGEIFGGVPEVTDPIRPSRGISSFAMLSDWDGDGVRELAFGLPFTDSLSLAQVIGTADPALAAPLDPSGYFRSGAVVVVAGVVLRPDLGFPGRNVINLAAIGTLAHVPLGCEACEPDGCPCPEGFYGPKAPWSPCGATFYHEHWADINGTPNDGSIRLGCRFSSNDFGDAFGETVSAYDFDSIMISCPNRDPFVATILNSATDTSIPGGGVVSIYFVNVVEGFYPWTNVQAPGANADFNYAGMAGNPSADLIPDGGPYHYIVDDFRLFEFQPGRLLPGSPGYVVEEDDSEPCRLVITVDAPIEERTTRIWGGFPGARIGGAVAIEDFNADGLTDILIGSPLGDEGRGACFIVLGRLRDLVMSGELPLDELGLAMDAGTSEGRRIFDGIRVVGSPGARLGQSQAGAGDFNNDGVADVAIGSPLVNNRRGGVAVFFGSRDIINLTQVEIPFDELPSRGLGVIFEGEQEGDLAGARVAGVRDIDGDGNDDILIAAPNASVQLDIDQDGTIEIDRTTCGVVYLIYGSPELAGRRLSLADVGTADLPGAVFIGRKSGDFLGAGLGFQGDRSYGIATAGDVDGDGRNDLLFSSVTASPRDRAAAGEVYLLYGVGD